jgi:hypothetical protein
VIAKTQRFFNPFASISSILPVKMTMLTSLMPGGVGGIHDINVPQKIGDD